MAGGPIFPYSQYPVTTDRVFPYIYVGAGSGPKQEEGLGVQASVGADSTWLLFFKIPKTLPSGTAKLILTCRANASSGVARINPKWASVAIGEDPSSATMNAEGVTPDARAGNAGGSGDTLTWGTGDADQYLELKWTLNADTVTAGEIIAMNLVFETASWTLAQILCCWATIEWE